jgi:REP element-mobilizing transposase RayT
MRPYEDIDIHARNLPHWSQDNVLAFVTWRLADSLPHVKLQEIEEKQKTFLCDHPEPWSEEILRLYRKNVSREMEAFLDSGCGSCVLKDESIRKEVEDALCFFDGRRYRLHGFVVMPNHVHVLFELFSGYPQTKVLHSWKSFTATAINKALGRQGQLWQDESWDRLIRNEKHYRNCLEYIQNNNVRLARIFVNGTGSTGILPVHSTNRQDACSPSGEPRQKN